MSVLDAALLRLRGPFGCSLAGNENLPPDNGLDFKNGLLVPDRRSPRV